ASITCTTLPVATSQIHRFESWEYVAMHFPSCEKAIRCAPAPRNSRPVDLAFCTSQTWITDSWSLKASKRRSWDNPKAGSRTYAAVRVDSFLPLSMFQILTSLDADASKLSERNSRRRISCL